MEEPLGFQGLRSHAWRVETGVEAWNRHGFRTGAERVAIPAGTSLHLDQTDWCIQGCDQGEVFVWQRFRIVDGPLRGQCVEFIGYRPDAFTAWVPNGLVPSNDSAVSREAGLTNRP